MSFFSNLFPYTNFHDLNMDWIIKKLMSAVLSVNGRFPDENGNVIVPQVEGVTSVNGILPDQNGDVNTYQIQRNEITLASGITGPGWAQYVVKIGKLAYIAVQGQNSGSVALTNNDLLATGLFPALETETWLNGLVAYQNPPIRLFVNSQGELRMGGWEDIPVNSYFSISGMYFTE